MLDYAMKVALDSARVSDDDHQALRAHFSDDEIWDIGAIAAFFAMSNRLANAMEIKPNDEFYGLGR